MKTKTNKIIRSSVIFMFVTSVLSLLLYSYAAFADWGAFHSSSQGTCYGQNCVTWHNNGYDFGDYPNGTNFPTFNGFTDRIAASGRTFDERQFMLVEPEGANGANGDGYEPGAGSPWWDGRQYDFNNGDSHNITFSSNSDTKHIGFWGYIHNNGDPANSNYDSEDTRIRVTGTNGLHDSFNPRYAIWGSNTKPRTVWSDTDITANMPFEMDLVEGYFYRESPDGTGEELIKLSNGQLNSISGSNGILINSNANFSGGYFEACREHFAIVYLEYEITPEEEQTPECRSLEITWPAEANDGEASVNVFNLPSWEIDENGLSDQIMQIAIDADEGSYDHFQYITPNSNKILFKRYIADTDLTNNLFTNKLYTYLDGLLDEGDTQFLFVFAVDEDDHWIGGNCADAVKITRPEPPQACLELNTDPGRNYTEELYPNVEIDISVDNLVSEDGVTPYTDPDSSVALLEYCYTGDIDWNWGQNNIFPALQGEGCDEGNSETSPYDRFGTDYGRNFYERDPFGEVGSIVDDSGYIKDTILPYITGEQLMTEEIYKDIRTDRGYTDPSPIESSVRESVSAPLKEVGSEVHYAPIEDKAPLVLAAAQPGAEMQSSDLQNPGSSVTAATVAGVAESEYQYHGAAAEAIDIFSENMSRLPVRENCVVTTSDQILIDVMPLEPGTLTIKAATACDECWDSFDVIAVEGQCIELTIDQTEFAGDNSEYSVTVDVDPDETEYRIDWIVERPGNDGPFLHVTTENGDENINLDDEGYVHQEGDILHAQAIADHADFDPNNICIDSLSGPVSECLELTFEQTEFTPDNSNYAVTVSTDPAGTEYDVHWIIVREGETNPVLDVTTTGATRDEINLDSYTTYTFQEGDVLHAQAVNINDPNSNCLDQLLNIPVLGECLDLKMDQNEFIIEDPTYSVVVNTDPADEDYQILWTVERDGQIELQVTTDEDFLDLRDYPNYTAEPGDSLRAVAIGINDDDNNCVDLIVSQTPDGECTDLDIEQTRLEPNEPLYDATVTTDPTGEFYRVEWTIERDGVFVFLARTDNDSIDFRDYSNFNLEFGDTLEARAIDIFDPNNACIDAISAPLEEGECLDLDINQNEFDPRDSTYSVNVDVDPSNASYRVEWTIHRDRDTVLRVRTRNDYIDLDEYPGFTARPGDELRARVIDIDDPNDVCRDRIDSDEDEEEEDCTRFRLDRTTFERNEDQEICVDDTDWPYFDTLEISINDGDIRRGVYVDNDLCFTIRQEDLDNADEIEVWIDGYRNECSDELRYEPNPPQFDKNVKEEDEGISSFSNRTITDFNNDRVEYEIRYEHSNQDFQDVEITDTIGRNNGRIQGYIRSNSGDILGESGYIEYDDSSFEITIDGDVAHECDDDDDENDPCYKGDIGDSRGVTVYNVNYHEEVVISYTGTINTKVSAAECSNPDSLFNRLGYCGEIYDNTANFDDDVDRGSSSTEVYIPCPYIIIRSGGDVFLENPFDYGIDTLVCAEIANVPDTIIEPDRPSDRVVVSTGGDDSVIPVMDHRLCSQQGEGSPEGYEGIDKLSSLICEVSLEVSEDLQQAAIVQNINTNKERIARYDKNLNLPWNQNLKGDVDSKWLPTSTNNVYYKDDGDLVFDNGSGDVVFSNGARTFVVEGHDVIINSNIRYEDAGNLTDPRNIASISIIVIGGDIIIDESVTETSGVFFVQENPNTSKGGKICEKPAPGREACVNEEGNAEFNNRQYTHYGSIYGDIQHLFRFRIFAGDPTLEEGAVVIRFDNRVFLNTPPILGELVELSIAEAAI